MCGLFKPKAGAHTPLLLTKTRSICAICAIRQRALRKRNFVVKGFVMKVLWQDYTFS